MNGVPVTIELVQSSEPVAKNVSLDVVEDTVGHLGAIISTSKGRKIAYAIYAGVALVVGNTAVGYAAANIDQPIWLVVASAIVANLATAFSALAIANVRGNK